MRNRFNKVETTSYILKQLKNLSHISHLASGKYFSQRKECEKNAFPFNKLYIIARRVPVFDARLFNIVNAVFCHNFLKEFQPVRHETILHLQFTFISRIANSN
jgi:hypothetical protein